MNTNVHSEAGDSTTPPEVGDLFATHPLAMLAQARSLGSVVESFFPIEGAQRAWMVVRMQEAVQVLKESQVFTVESPVLSSQERGQQMKISIIGSSMLNVDGLDHRRLRGLVSKVFTPKYIQSLRPTIQRIADELLDKVQDQGSMDLVSDFGFPLPIQVIADFLGIPQRNWDVVREGSSALIELGSKSIILGQKGSEQLLEKLQAFDQYVIELLAEKRRHPQDDLMSQLVQSEEEDHLSEAELLPMIGLLITAGHETTSNFLGNGILALFDHPDQMELLKSDLRLIPTAVEELLRFSTPVFTGIPRFATQDIDLGGQHIKAGDMLMVMLTSANYDETSFRDADDLDLIRTLNRHLTFGYGIHVCLGAPLARLESDIALTTLFRRMPDLHLRVPRASIQSRVFLNIRGLKSLPVAF